MSKALVLFVLLSTLAKPQMPPTGSKSYTFWPVAVGMMPFGAKGDCKSDDWAALQSALNQHQEVYLPPAPGGCYLVSRTLTLQAGNYLHGAGTADPNSGDLGAGVIIRLSAGANVPLLRTYTAGSGSGNQYMDVENIVFDGNGSKQTRELQHQALVDYRGTFVGCFLRHVVIINAFGPALYTGDGGGDLRIDTLWIINTSSSTYSWVHNPSTAGFGTLNADHVFVENQSEPKGGLFRQIAYGDPTTYGHAVFLNGVQNGLLKTTHCESALTCVDFASVQSLILDGISGSRIGNPSAADPSSQFLVRMLDTKSYQFTMTGAYFDQSGSTYSGSFANARVFGLASGLQTNDWYQTPAGKALWPFYTHGEFYSQSGWPYLGERAVIGNELWIQQIGAYSPNGISMWDNTGAPNGSYAYVDRNGTELNLGFSPGPRGVNEETLLRLKYYGVNSPGNNVQVSAGRLETGSAENVDLSGELNMSSSRTVSLSFTGAYNSHPECVATPQFDPGNNRMWITYTGTSAFTINFAAPVSGVVSYLCIARN